jgi:predicted MFS family arabinose efflux permease
MRATPEHPYRWVVLGMAFMGVFAGLGFGRFGYSAVLPAMQQALGISSAAAGSLASWNLLGYTAMAAAGGVIAARWGARRVITAGLAISALGMLLTGVSDSLGGASAARLLTGMGNGMMFVPSIALMASWFRVRQLGLASTIVPTGSSLAMILVGPVVPRLIAAGGDEGWRLAWYFFAAVTAATALANAIVQRDRPKGAPSRADSLAFDKNAPPAIRAWLRANTPGVRTVLRSGYAWHLGLVYFLFGVAFLLYFTFFQKRLTTDLGYSGETAGYLFMVLGAAGLAGGMLWGSVSDRFGRRQTIALTLFLSGFAAILFAVRPTMATLVISAVLFGSTGPIFPGLMGAACADRFGPMLAPAALGLITILVGVGQTVGPLIGGAMNDAYASLGPSYLFSGVTFFVGGAVALALHGSGGRAGSVPTRPLPALPVDRRPFR